MPLYDGVQEESREEQVTPGAGEDFGTPPADRGVRLDWTDTPERVRSEVERWLGGAVVGAVTQPTGFSPGVAARLTADNGCRVFLKAVGTQRNAVSPTLHRREISVVSALPEAAPVPRLLWSHDEGEGGWVVLVFEDVDGRHPTQPWRTDELDRVVAAMEELSTSLTPSPLPAGMVGTAGEAFSTVLRGWRQLLDEWPSRLDRLDAWSRRHIETLAAVEDTVGGALEGDTLLHADIRGDNILLTPKRTWFVDWPHACVGPSWVDVVAFAPSVAMQGGPPPEEVIARHSACRAADGDAITAVVVAMAGYLTRQALQPPPPGLPTVRAFQAAQGVVARRWVARRTGMRGGVGEAGSAGNEVSGASVGTPPVSRQRL